MFLVARERAFGRHLGENALERDACAARNAERPRDLALPGLPLRGIQEFKDLLFARQTAVGGNARCGMRFADWRLPS
ncbi:hypothetical protein HYPDE_35203 [Hyphomicrobium denitrificans 1NES1]|uniref:Uncharacterized protein n=1 Tax=Hyphomicrobium denitrificans 1NES1 TaxID=670307 RepID=N0B8U7_9HYPH|nr:hypothetical protein HYPDE_35203 [Hyphomicrobium denitrificans 1NES1]